MTQLKRLNTPSVKELLKIIFNNYRIATDPTNKKLG